MKIEFKFKKKIILQEHAATPLSTNPVEQLQVGGVILYILAQFKQLVAVPEQVAHLKLHANYTNL